MADRMVTAPNELAKADKVPFDSSGRAGLQAPTTPSRRSSGGAVAQVLALSGQMPRRVDSIPPAESRESTKAAAESAAENLLPADNARARSLSINTPDNGELAFALRTVAIRTSEDAVRSGSGASHREAEGPRRISIPDKQVNLPVPEPEAASENRPSPGWELSQPPGRERRLEETPFERAEPHTNIPGEKVIPHAAPETLLKAESSSEHPEALQAKSARPQDALETQAKPEVAKGTPVRDMKFEVTSSDRRVEVRLSERGGEMKMTVRTPDSNLASTLRDNLPTLSTRLAESGFKSETLHPTASTSEWHHSAESSKGGAFQDSNPPPREQNRESRDGTGQQHPKRPQEPVRQQQKGRDFAWLMSSLR